MKRIYLSLIVCSTISYIFDSGCKKIEDLFRFTVSNETSITIKSSSPVNLPINIVSPDVTTNSSEQFKNNNTEARYVRNIVLENLQLTITNPPNQNFNFLKSIHIYISTNTNDEILLAYLDQVPKDVNAVTLISTGAKLDVYVKASSYQLRTEVITNEIITKDITVNAASKFEVTADL